MKNMRPYKIFGILLMVLVLGMLTGCGDKKEGPACKDILKSYSEIAEKGTFDSISSYGEKLYDDSFSNLYGITWDMIDDGGICYTEAGGVADEISIFHLKKNEDISLAKEKLNNRIEERKKVFGAYKPEEMEKLENATIMVQGNFIALIVSTDNESVEMQLRKYISDNSDK